SQPSQRNEHRVSGRNGTVAPPPRVTKPRAAVTPTVPTVAAEDFVKRRFPPVAWIVQNVMPEGLTMLAGKPKTGKSFLAVNVSVAVACGGKALGHLNVEQGRVLYVNLD